MAGIRELLTGLPGFSPPRAHPSRRYGRPHPGSERDCIIASYTVADKVAQEDQFILSARQFNVTLTRARAKVYPADRQALLRYLPSRRELCCGRATLQRFCREPTDAPLGTGLPFASSTVVRGGSPNNGFYRPY